jgi:hypothetical protein
MNIVPLELRPHLIPFLYKEFEGVEYQYLKEKVKVCKVDTRSTFGFTIITTLKKVDYPVKPNSKFYVYIGFNVDGITAKMYKLENYEDTFLMVPDCVKENINDILEDQFRMAFQFHSRGMMKADKTLKLKDVVADFMQEYEMDEYGFELASMLKVLSRGKEHKLSRIQNQTPRTLRNKSVSNK